MSVPPSSARGAPDRPTEGRDEPPDVEGDFRDRSRVDQAGWRKEYARMAGGLVAPGEERDEVAWDQRGRDEAVRRGEGLPASATSTASQRLAAHLAEADPALPRMRRAARTSPNSRSERPAPSSIASSAFSSSVPSRPPLQHRTSLPTGSTRRERASSLGPTGARAEGDVSPNRRHLNPDEHWLSEDESTSYAQALTSRVRFDPTRRAPRPDGPDEPDAPKVVADALETSAIPPHPIHHAPAKAGTAVEPIPIRPITPIRPRLADILPALLPHLTCITCHQLFIEPTTLSCGHTRCITCEPPPSSRPPFLVSPPLAASGLTAAASPFSTPPLDKAPPRFPSTSMPGAFIPRSESLTSLTSASSAAPSHITSQNRLPFSDLPNPPTCPHPSCSTLPPASQQPSLFLRPDVSLRKVVDLVRRHLPEVDQQLDCSKAGATSEAPLESLFQSTRLSSATPYPDEPKPGGLDRHGSGDSGGSHGSSGGGEDQPRDEDESKRAHKASKTWKTSKKSRRTEATPPPFSSSTSTSAPPAIDGLPYRTSSFFSELQTECCECQVCVQLFHEPVTVPCGHSFCRGCLARAYDHSTLCPLCRSSLPPFSSFRSQRPNLALTSVISTALPLLAADRAASVAEETLAALASVPIFVCTTAWPGIKCFLHIFEPRYRLMIRRALESPEKTFGMVLAYRDSSGASVVHEYGTMLRITSCNVLEDGRMVIETVGTHRFRVRERGMLDGYNVGRIERVEDVSLEQEAELERLALARNGVTGGEGVPGGAVVERSMDELLRTCFEFITTLRDGSAPWVIERLNRTVGDMPTDPHDFTWFAAEVFPVEDQVKVMLLQITSVRERLRLIVYWIEQFRASWWYTRGCTFFS
ncbi:hypothetical protein JCM8547_008101 [Rhodosporidiobolus lusitaniae]